MGDEAGPNQAPDLAIDDNSKSKFVKWYNNLQSAEDGAPVVRFFAQPSCYTVHGADAVSIAQTYYRTTAVVKYYGAAQTGLPVVTLNRSLFERVLRDLLVERADHAVELWEGSGSAWKLAKSASPGKLSAFEDEMFRSSDMPDTPVVMAVSLAQSEGSRVVGVAFLDGGARKLGAAEFADDDQFCTLEAVAMQLGAKECALVKGAPTAADAADHRRLRDVLSRCGVLPSERERSAFNARNLEQDLGRLLRGGNVEQHRDVLDRAQARPALAAVLDFTEVMADQEAHGKYALELYDSGRYMRLDSAAQRALNVLKSKLDANDTFSLYGLLNRGRTPMGKRLCKVWLKQPLVDLGAIRARHDLVEALVTDLELRERLRDQCLRGMPDTERLTRKLERRKVSLADLCQLYRASSKLPGIVAALQAHEGPHAALLSARYAQPLAATHDEEHLAKFEELLEAAVDLDRIPEEYLIASSYDAGLQELAAAKAQANTAIDSAARDVEQHLGLELGKTLKLEWHRASNTRTRCLRITAKEEKAVRSKLQGGKYETLETRKDGTKFTSKAMRAAAAELQNLSGQYDAQQAHLVEQVVGVAHTFVVVWEEVTALLAEMDVLAGFAELAASAPTPYVRPIMLPPDAGELVLEGCRHPCVEAQEGVEFIKNDCRMVRGESWLQLITGPNMGGKSTFIRQVGVNVLLAQVGCWVPCDSARIAVRDAIFARVGAGDCQLRGVSTFMAEMLETAAILKGATSQSLVIIDELGRGTSTYDGFGLAWAISEHLMQEVGAPTLFATHFHELTALQGPVGVANRHVQTAIDDATGRLTMLYQVVPGACDQSFGIHVAEFAQFPPEVVALAKRKAAELESCADPAALSQDGIATGRKRIRADDTRSGAAVARAFLEEFAALPLQSMAPEESLKRTKELYSQLVADAEAYPPLKALLQPAAA